MMLPAGLRQRDQTKKDPTGPLDRDALMQHLEKQAMEVKEREDLVPFTGEKKGKGRAAHLGSTVHASSAQRKPGVPPSLPRGRRGESPEQRNRGEVFLHPLCHPCLYYVWSPALGAKLKIFLKIPPYSFRGGGTSLDSLFTNKGEYL